MQQVFLKNLMSAIQSQILLYVLPTSMDLCPMNRMFTFVVNEFMRFPVATQNFLNSAELVAARLNSFATGLLNCRMSNVLSLKAIPAQICLYIFSSY